jgi:hypothetical protein
MLKHWVNDTCAVHDVMHTCSARPTQKPAQHLWLLLYILLLLLLLWR